MKATQFHRTITGVSLDKQDAVCSCLSLTLLVRIGRKKVGVVAGENQMLILLFLQEQQQQSKPVAVAAIAAAAEEQSRMVQFLWSSFLLACEELLLLRQFPLLRFLRKLNCLLGVSSRIMKHGFHFR